MEKQIIKETNQIRDDDILATCLKEQWEREKQILVDGEQEMKKLNEMSTKMVKKKSKIEQKLISLGEEKKALSQNLSSLNESLVECQVEQIIQLTSVNEELRRALDMAEKNADRLEQQVNELQDRLKEEDHKKSEIQSSAAKVEIFFAEFVKKCEAEKKDLSARFWLLLGKWSNPNWLKGEHETKDGIEKLKHTADSNAELEKENTKLKDDIEKLKQQLVLAPEANPET
uniref:Uncharacterized protein n=1 Tax=Ditylenchus dipsaci TaxID=166011 RepID=A0A915DSB0_9BILA